MLLSKYPVLVGAKVFSPEAADKLGQFGDYIGGLLNPLISCFTLMVAIMVWRLQKSEMAETKKALEDQAKTSEQQRREARFFDLMRVYQNTVDAIFVDPSSSKNGKAAILKSFGTSGSSLFELLEHGQPGSSSRYNSLEVNGFLQQKWSSLQRESPYFRVVFQVLSQLDPLLVESQYDFAKLFRAQLSNDELALIAWCLLHSKNADTAKLLVAKYGLLKHLYEGTLRRLVLADDSISKHVFGREFAEKQSTT
jgi:hypothetical protein